MQILKKVLITKSLFIVSTINFVLCVFGIFYQFSQKMDFLLFILILGFFLLCIFSFALAFNLKKQNKKDAEKEKNRKLDEKKMEEFLIKQGIKINPNKSLVSQGFDCLEKEMRRKK